MTIVYLPDGCREFAISQSNFLSSASLGLTLKDGWQLSALQSSGDTTATVKAVIDGLAGIAGGKAGAGASGGSGSPGKSGGSQAQGGLPTLFIHTKAIMLKPGYYPMLVRKGATAAEPCNGKLMFENPASNSANTYEVDQFLQLALQ